MNNLLSNRLNKTQALRRIWNKTHQDFKSVYEGQKTILVCRGATCLVPLDDLTDAEIRSRVPEYDPSL